MEKLPTAYNPQWYGCLYSTIEHIVSTMPPASVEYPIWSKAGEKEGIFRGIYTDKGFEDEKRKKRRIRELIVDVIFASGQVFRFSTHTVALRKRADKELFSENFTQEILEQLRSLSDG